MKRTKAIKLLKLLLLMVGIAVVGYMYYTFLFKHQAVIIVGSMALMIMGIIISTITKLKRRSTKETERIMEVCELAVMCVDSINDMITGTNIGK